MSRVIGSPDELWMHPDKSQGQGVRPLIIRFGAMGDMVILTALIRTLHLRYGSRIDVACPGRWTPLLENQPWTGAVYPLYTRQLPFWLNPQQWLFVRRLRARGPGPVWICQTDDVSHSLIERAGYDSQSQVSQRDYSIRAGEHCVDRLLRMAMAAPSAPGMTPRAVTPPRYAPRLFVPGAWRNEVHTWLAGKGLSGRPLVLIQAGNKRTMRLGSRRRSRNRKYWPEANWATVIDRIHALTPDAAILLLGVWLESGLNRAILRCSRTRAAVNIAGDAPIPRLLALSVRALGMISVDTGPAHVAAAAGCPLVVLFGDQDPSFYGPRSEISPVEIVTGTRAAERPMLDIMPDDVVAAWQRLQRSGAAMRTSPGHGCAA